MLSYLSFTLSSIYGLFQTSRADIIFVESPPLFLSFSAFAFGLFRPTPFVFNIADLWPDSVKELGVLEQGPILRFAEWFEGWSYRQARFVIAVTEGIRKTLLEQKHVPAEKLLFLPNGADTVMFKPQEPDLELLHDLNLEGRRVILYAGTLGIAQGLEVVIEAMDLLRHQRPDALFVFIGDGSEAVKLKALVQAKQLENVRFLEPQPIEYIARLYTVVEIGFASLKNLPLFEGARPSKVFPIMASGKPVLYSGAGEGARLIESAQAGVVTAPEDAVALKHGMLELLSNTEKARTCGKNGRRYVEENLSWPALVKSWLEQLEERLGEQRGA